MHRSRGVAAVVVLSAIVGAYAIITRPPSPITAPDTTAYVNASPLVPIGYPLVLRALGVEGTAVFQPLMFAAALAVLGTEMVALLRSAWPAAAAIAGIIMIPQMMTFHASILTESLFISGLTAFAAANIRFARAPSTRTIVIAAVIAGLTAAVRRTAYGFVPAVLLMMIVLWRSGRASAARVLAAGLLPLVVIYGADWAISTWWHGERMTSLTGRHLFAKAALIEAAPLPPGDVDPLRAQVSRELERTYAPVRELLRTAPREIRASLILYYETCLQGPCAAALRESIALDEAAKNALLGDVARERIRRAPAQFAALTMTHYGSLWTAYKLRHPATAAHLATFLAAHRPLPFEREAFKVRPDEPLTFEPNALVSWLQPAVMVIGVVTAVVAVVGGAWALTGRAPPVVLGAALVAVSAHASLLFTAAAAAGIARFMIAVFPAVLVATILAASALLQKQLGGAWAARYD